MKSQIIVGLLLSAGLAGAQTFLPAPNLNLASNSAIAFTATATNDLTSLLQRGLFEEEGNRDYHAAIFSYEGVVTQFDRNRQLAATAIFRLGECYRKLGRTNEAVTQYERIIREFSDQQTLATLSRQNVAGLGSPASTSTALANQGALVTADDEEKEIRRIQKMIQDSPDLINVLGGEDYTTPLIRAAGKDQLQVASFLLSQGADVNRRGEKGETALIVAAASGHNSMVELLLNNRAEINIKRGGYDNYAGSKPLTALDCAVSRGFVTVVGKLLTHKADVNLAGADGMTPLHRAAQSSSKRIAELLLSYGAEVNANNFENQTPLHLATTPEIVSLLLANKASVNARAKSGGTPLHFAAAANHAEIIKLLLTAGAAINARDEFGETPLALAARIGRAEAVNALLDGKADPNLAATSGGYRSWTPLHHAANGGWAEIAEALLEHGANPDALIAANSTSAGSTPLNLALGKRASDEVVHTLLKHKANPNLPSAVGACPLQQAIDSRRDIDLTKALLDAGADVNAPITKDGWLPLQLAVATGNKAIVETVLTYHPDVNAIGWKNATALDEARGKSSEIAALLHAHGAIDDLPDFKSIRVTRAGGGWPFVVFVRDANSINRFTLLEVIRNFYGNSADNREKPFPDFSKIIIHRPVAGNPNAAKEITVNLMTVTNSFDCTKNTWLEFGDVVEIPEREHSLAEQPLGITEAQSKELSQCLEGKATFVVRGEKTELKLDGSGHTCWLQLALGRVQNLLRSSSDLSHIKINRTDPVAKVKREIVADSKSPQQDNVWLRDGDVIEVPDK